MVASVHFSELAKLEFFGVKIPGSWESMEISECLWRTWKGYSPGESVMLLLLRPMRYLLQQHQEGRKIQIYRELTPMGE